MSYTLVFTLRSRRFYEFEIQEVPSSNPLAIMSYPFTFNSKPSSALA